MIEINLTFSAIHETTLGWLSDDDTQSFNGGYSKPFPYGAHSGKSSNEYQDAEDIAKYNKENRATLENKIDNLQEEAVQNEQMKQQAEARYAGMFGDMRLAGDKRRAQNASDYYKSQAAKAGDPNRNKLRQERSARRAARAYQTSQNYQDVISAEIGEDFVVD